MNAEEDDLCQAGADGFFTEALVPYAAEFCEVLVVSGPILLDDDEWFIVFEG
jgi:hypothetical protein